MRRDQFFYLLPYTARRTLYALFRAEEYKRFQKKRRKEKAEGYSFKPFDDYHCIFVHIPKTAGVSVSRSLFGNFSGGHTYIKTYQVIFPKNEFERYFKFTFVRNPWDRLFSAYTFLRKGGFHDGERRWARDHLAPYHDFDDFVKRWVNAKNILRYAHFYPQYRFLCLPFMDKAAVDFLGLYENLQEDFDYIQHKIFGERTRVLPHHNKSSVNIVRDYKEFYTEESRKIVAEVYAKDITLLGYNFDNSSLQSQLQSRR